MSASSFGKYQLLKKLATGGMAEVWLARQTGIEGFNRTVVLKRILPHLAEDREFVDMFLNEARIAAKFNHPNIAQIIELGVLDDSYFIAMEYIHGEDLGRVMRKAWSSGQWIAQPLAIRIVAACCEGLSYAHNKTDDNGRPLRVVHRDISPQNILISFDGTVKLVDFGIAKAADLPSLTKSGAIKGKFAYMAPEQAAGKPLDQRCDIFAIGLVLYELLTGVRPLKRDNEIATLQAALECAIEPPSVVAEVPSDLDGVVMKALAKAADDRYRDARQFQMALEEFLVSQRLVASSVQLSELMHTLFADRLEEEAKTGQPEPPSEASSSRAREVSRTGGGGQSGAWDAAASASKARQGSRGMAKGNYVSGEKTAPPPAPAADLPDWEAPPGVDQPRRTRTGMAPAAEPRARVTDTGTAIARTPSRPDNPRTRSGVSRTRTALGVDEDDAADQGYDAGTGAYEEPGELTGAVPPEPAPPRRTASSAAVPRTTSRAGVRRATANNLARAVDPVDDREDVPPPRALQAEDSPKRRNKLTGEIPRQQAKKPSGPKAPRRTQSREARALEGADAPPLEELLDVEAYKEKSRRRLKTVLWISTVAALGLSGFIFRDAIVATLTSVGATGQGIYLSVETNVPVKVFVKHHPDEGAEQPLEALSKTPISRELRLQGAHLRDTIILENETLDLRHEHEIAFGQPGDLIGIKKEFKTGHVRFELKPALRDLVLYNPRTGGRLGSANLKIELAEGEHELELRGDSLKQPQTVRFKIIGGDVVTETVALRGVIDRYR